MPKLALPEPDPAAAGHTPNESARALDGLALEAWKQGDAARAVELFEEAVAADPDDHVPRSHYGRLLTLATDYERALPHLSGCGGLPGYPQTVLDLQTVYERTHASTSWEPAGVRGLAGDPQSQTEGGYEIDGPGRSVSSRCRP